MKLGVTYLGNRFVRHYVERDLPEIAAAGCDFVVHTFSEHDLAFHRGEVAGLVAATRDAGLDAWLDCWGLGGLFAGEAFSDFLLRRPEAWRLRPDGGREPSACPNAPAFRELLRSWMRAAAETGAGAVFLDDPMPPGAPPCACELGADPAELHGEGAAADGVAGLLAAACADAHALGMRAAVGVLPGEDADALAAQTAAARDADVIAVSPLWRAHGRDVSPYVGDSCAQVVAACAASGQEPMAWLQAFGIPAGREGEIAEAADAMAAAGVASVSAWCYRAGEQMTAIRSERPDEAWGAVVAAYRRLKGG